jgi:hypothetical protein
MKKTRTRVKKIRDTVPLSETNGPIVPLLLTLFCLQLFVLLRSENKQNLFRFQFSFDFTFQFVISILKANLKGQCHQGQF